MFRRTMTLISIVACWSYQAAANPLGLPELSEATGATDVRVTWYGVATLLFDDGQTRFLIDGFFSRPSMTSNEPIAPDEAQIDRMIEAAGLQNIAGITPVHSHFDHAMDLGLIALKTGATVIGSESTANIARGAGVGAEQIRVVTGDRESFEFGAFEVTLIRSRHAPLVDGGPPIPGTIDEPLAPPAMLTDWKEGASFSVVVAHPSGTVVVQGSAGFLESSLMRVRADVVFLGIGGLNRLGEDHASTYWTEIVERTGARCVVPIHWDDFSQPLGRIVAGEGVDESLAWISEHADRTRSKLAAVSYGVAVDPFDTACGG